jgi:hypothetical protein
VSVRAGLDERVLLVGGLLAGSWQPGEDRSLRATLTGPAARDKIHRA